SIEENTFDAIRQKAASIEYVAIERIQVELSKIFISAHAAFGIEYMEKTTLSNFLNGDFTSSDWTRFYSEDRQVGWAYFCLVNGSDLTLLTKYRCSNKEKLFVKTVLDAYGSLLSEISLADLMRFDPMILKTAYQFTIWQNHKLESSYEQLVARKNTLPIQHVNELAITGKDLLEWSPK
ncbi:MAG: hypothetical protein ABS891_10655, partial [Enterococcus casseliflavus]